MKVLLDDGEIEVAISEAVGLSEEHTAHPRFEKEKYLLRIQLKKIVNIIRRDCPETLFLLEDLPFWHNLLEATE